MSHITFQRVASDEARILDDGEVVGDVYRQRNTLEDGAVFYVVHLTEDPGGFVRVHDRSRIREVTEDRLRTHPLFG